VNSSWISLSKAHASDTLSDLFNLPVSMEAFEQLQELEAEFSAITLIPSNDGWTYICGGHHISPHPRLTVCSQGTLKLIRYLKSFGKPLVKVNTKFSSGQFL